MMVSTPPFNHREDILTNITGWATGIRLSERAEDHIQHRDMRDSGVSASQASHMSQPRTRRTSSPPPGEVKAFPLVCVCLPEHWQKTIESEVQQHTSSDYDYRSSDATDEGQGEDPGSMSEASPVSRRVGEKSSSRFKDDLNVGREPRDPPSAP